MGELSNRRVFMFIAVSASLLLLFFGRGRPSDSGGAQQSFLLASPLFVHQADAESTSAIGEKLDSEAGISAYYQTPGAIVLDQVRPLFRTIELETPDYIVGSVAVPDYTEHYDVHVYVDKTGWILAYYMNDVPVAKMVDVRGNTIDTTILSSIVASVAGAAGEPFGDVTYYDFRYPNATHLLLVAEFYNSGDNDFAIELPGSYGYLERSWALWNAASAAYFQLDGVNQPNIYWNGVTGYNFIPATDLLPGVSHTIRVDDYGVLAIVYRVP